ncbi:hypothetical protein ACFQ22_10360 [Lentilactobacillus raoultii]|uniref:Uncharacterized protein n=1 Tax=Lentilactobacillus raoultii TaxID=1987503 RepID=A0ABW3PTP2_9LACO|nr:hypothetical protein [Lentilactobacillus raoultii]
MNSNKIKRLKKQFKKTGHHRAQFRLFSSPDRSYYAFDGDNGEALVYIDNTMTATRTDLINAVLSMTKIFNYSYSFVDDQHVVINGEVKLVYFTKIGRLPIVAAYPTDMATSQRDKMIRVLYDKREERWSDR